MEATNGHHETTLSISNASAKRSRPPTSWPGKKAEAAARVAKPKADNAKDLQTELEGTAHTIYNFQFRQAKKPFRPLPR